MCYEKWMEGEQATETLENAKKEADKLIDKVKSIVRPDRRPEPATRPAMEHEETAA